METLKIHMNEEIRPSGDRVLIRLKAPETKSAGGIIFTEKTIEQSKFATQKATVVRLGWDAYRGLGSGKKWCDVGDVVRVSKYSGEDLIDLEEGYVYRIISDEDVHCDYPNQHQQIEVTYGDVE